MRSMVEILLNTARLVIMGITDEKVDRQGSEGILEQELGYCLIPVGIAGKKCCYFL